ncbi:predicted protein [Nematostella vectensis]|uniref:Uncharacterized protein n=1 Tax=Nematostella vectensis TaxID=45351 RepID=A7SHL3_NEMVE|nr:predicted protein [Nematostella vectensis]|eukprot:XP_001628861.1 predicted protein [Nematostella vectensis]
MPCRNVCCQGDYQTLTQFLTFCVSLFWISSSFTMNQMEHNVKIHDYKRMEETRPFNRTNYWLNYSQKYPNSETTRHMEERFRYIQWPRNETLVGMKDGDRMKFTRNQQISVLHNQHETLADVEAHRHAHLRHIQTNKRVAREEFDRSVRLDRPGIKDKMRGQPPLFKIINNATLRG